MLRHTEYVEQTAEKVGVREYTLMGERSEDFEDQLGTSQQQEGKNNKF